MFPTPGAATARPGRTRRRSSRPRRRPSRGTSRSEARVVVSRHANEGVVVADGELDVRARRLVRGMRFRDPRFGRRRAGPGAPVRLRRAPARGDEPGRSASRNRSPVPSRAVCRAAYATEAQRAGAPGRRRDIAGLDPDLFPRHAPATLRSAPVGGVRRRGVFRRVIGLRPPRRRARPA